jgi:hypothetical protein
MITPVSLRLTLEENSAIDRHGEFISGIREITAEVEENGIPGQQEGRELALKGEIVGVVGSRQGLVTVERVDGIVRAHSRGEGGASGQNAFVLACWRGQWSRWPGAWRDLVRMQLAVLLNRREIRVLRCRCRLKELVGRSWPEGCMNRSWRWVEG